MTIPLPAVRLWLAIALGLALLLTGCGTANPTADPTAPSSDAPAPTTAVTGQLTVLGAASLTMSFTQLGAAFERVHPGTQVRFSFGSSATLATQVTQGAPADVFAAASPATMKTVLDAGAATDSRNFASNTLEIAVPTGNPGKISGLADFADAGKKIAICAPQVPCGAATAQVFAAAQITPKPDTLEQDVKATLAKVSANEVDAALVYRTDVIAAAQQVEGITFPESDKAVNEYPIATLTDSTNKPTAEAFITYVVSDAGRAELRKAGFATP